MGILIWVACIIFTYILAENKKRNIASWVVFSMFLAPLALVIILFMPKKTDEAIKGPALNVSPSSMKIELEEIKNRLSSLMNRIQNLEVKINTLLDDKETIPEPIKSKPLEIEKKVILKEETDIETNLGRFWLNKIGIIVFVLGIGFLITYTFRYFGALAKIMISYLIGVCLFFFGSRLEKKKGFLNYGYVLLGGAWATIYFTTYAMHHFDASKVINSQLLDLLFLGIVAIGMILYSLKYKSEALSAVALFIGYITATLGDVSYFTFLSSVLLALATLVLVYKMQWVRLIFAGIFLTYFTHYFWVIKQIYFSLIPVGRLNVEQVYFLINSGFLFVYWSVFTIGIHIIKKPNNGLIYNKLSTANFCNFMLFFFTIYPKLFKQYPEYKFTFVLGLGLTYLIISLIMEKMKNAKMSVSDIIIAISLLTLAVPLKFMPFQTSLIWLIELPFVLFIGLIFDRKALRYFSFILAIILFFKFLIIDFRIGGDILIFRHELPWNKLITAIGFVSMGICFCVNRYLRKKMVLSHLENTLTNLFSALGTAYLTLLIWLLVDISNLTLALFIETMAIFLLGYMLLDKFLRVYAILLLVIASYRLCLIDNFYISEIFKWVTRGIGLTVLYTVYFLYRKLRIKNLLGELEKPLTNIVFTLSTFLLAYITYRHVPSQWVSLGLGAAGVALFIVGFLSKDKVFRLGGFIIFAATLFKVIFVDFSMLSIIYKIISFIILGILFLGVSYIYTKSSINK